MLEDSFASYGKRTAVVVGMLHGVGAETATQILLFLSAANAGDRLPVSSCWWSSSPGSRVEYRHRTCGHRGISPRCAPVRRLRDVAVVTGVFSLAMGVLLLGGKGASLPPILAG
jgi:hypothetical protein